MCQQQLGGASVRTHEIDQGMCRGGLWQQRYLITLVGAVPGTGLDQGDNGIPDLISLLLQQLHWPRPNFKANKVHACV